MALPQSFRFEQTTIDDLEFIAQNLGVNKTAAAAVAIAEYARYLRSAKSIHGQSATEPQRVQLDQR